MDAHQADRKLKKERHLEKKLSLEGEIAGSEFEYEYDASAGAGAGEVEAEERRRGAGKEDTSSDGEDITPGRQAGAGAGVAGDEEERGGMENMNMNVGEDGQAIGEASDETSVDRPDAPPESRSPGKQMAQSIKAKNDAHKEQRKQLQQVRDGRDSPSPSSSFR